MGTLIVRAYGRWGSFCVMASVVAILLLVSVLRREGALVIQPVLLLAAAMGAQNAAVQPIGAARLGVTYVTERSSMPLPILPVRYAAKRRNGAGCSMWQSGCL